MSGNICRCEECQETFEIKIETLMLNDNVEATYFECPECSEKYSVWFKNGAVYDMEVELEKWQARINNPHMRKKARKELERIKKERAEIMNQLKQEYGNHV